MERANDLGERKMRPLRQDVVEKGLEEKAVSKSEWNMRKKEKGSTEEERRKNGTSGR